MKFFKAAFLRNLLQDSAAKEGATEAAILERVEPANFALSADDVVGLKKAGVAERVIARVFEDPSETKVVNLAHKAVSIRVVGSSIEVGDGDDPVGRGVTAAISGAGEYGMVVNGRPASSIVKTTAEGREGKGVVPPELGG